MDVVHYVGEVDEIARLLLVLLLVCSRTTPANVDSLTPTIICMVVSTVMIAHVLEVLHVAKTGNALEAANNILKILSIHGHLLPIGIESVLLVPVLIGSVSHLVLHAARGSLAPSLLLLLPNVLLLLVMLVLTLSHVLVLLLVLLLALIDCSLTSATGSRTMPAHDSTATAHLLLCLHIVQLLVYYVVLVDVIIIFAIIDVITIVRVIIVMVIV